MRYVVILIVAGAVFASGAGCGSSGGGTQTGKGGAAGTARGGAGGQAGTGGAGGAAGSGQGGQGGATGTGGTGGQSGSCHTNANCPSGQVCYTGSSPTCTGLFPGTCVTRESTACGQSVGAGCPCLDLANAAACTGQGAYCAGSDEPGQCWACKLPQ